MVHRISRNKVCGNNEDYQAKPVEKKDNNAENWAESQTPWFDTGLQIVPVAQKR